MFTTPDIYPSTFVPPDYRWLLYLNPMTGLIDAFRAVVFDTPLAWAPLGVSLVEATLLLSFGVAYFRKVERSFADVI
jgi:lipopolysaccharide transport system permease protein